MRTRRLKQGTRRLVLSMCHLLGVGPVLSDDEVAAQPVTTGSPAYARTH